jgi:polyhydroxyalkanoate synthesis regulator phasin
MQFKSELTANERAIVDLLSKDELMPSDGIAKVLKISADEVNTIIDKLNEGGYLDGTSATAIGEDIVSEDGAKTDALEVKYKYDWRPNVTPDNNAREFCQDMLQKHSAQSGWLTRAEIDNLNNGQDLPVWDSRGGWWNKGGVSVPYCRHNFYQQLVKRK